MRIRSIILAAALLLGGMASIVCTPGVQPATAQGSAPTAGMIPGQPSYAAGAPAMFKGLDFTPGETVTFQITHVRGTPVTNRSARAASATGANPVRGMSAPGMDHTPTAIVADPSGGFMATWMVCATDCVGELLQIEATGQTSGKIARAVFLDLPARPVPGASGQAGMKSHALEARANTPNAAAAPTFERIRSFGEPGSGAYPLAGLVKGTDGSLYGTASQGGLSGVGTVFKLNPDGSGFTTLHSFDYSSGAYPYGGLVQGTDGALYGTTYYGGAGSYGTVFTLNPDGTGFTVLQNFDYSTTGGYVYAGLVQGTDGALYGAAASGGTSGGGTVFKLNTNGSGFTVLQDLDYSTTGGGPYGGLAEGTDGALYGTAYSGGSIGYGTVFKLNPDGSGFTVLQNLDYSTTGAYPYFGGLRRGTDGALYGAAQSGGSSGYGTVFKLNPDGSGFTVLQNFDYSTTGAYPSGAPVQGTDGALYGTAVYGGGSSYGTAFKLNTDGTGFTVLHNFDYSTTGGYVYAGLAQGADGALYGTAYQGGTSGVGTVFKLNTDGTGFAVLKNLSYGTDLSAGAYPLAGPTQGTDGALYGTTQQGGTGGVGTVFKLNPDGTGFAALKSFDYSTTGAYPYSGGLTQGTDGTLYGTAYYAGPSGYGTVFKLNPDGTGFTVLHSFDYYSGAYPLGRVILGTDGALYGTTYYGGTSSYGTAFKLNTDGSGFTVLQNFDYSTTGGYVYAGLVQGTDGVLYGTAYVGGTSGVGTVFGLNTNGSGFTVLQNFDYSTTGAYPFGGLVQGTDGALYGAAYYGGTSGVGTVFKLNPNGSGFAVIQNFDYSTTGGYPWARLAQGTDGALYGTALNGGTGGAGTAFKLDPDGSNFSVLKNFDYGADGGTPYGALAEGMDGNFYGTTYQGGDAGVGTVYRLIYNSCTPPAISFCPPDQPVECGGATDPSATGTATATGTDVSVSFSDVFAAGCGNTGVITRTWTATGTCGTASCVQTITIVDTTAPVVTITGPASGTVYAVGTPVNFAGSFTDGCGAPHTATWMFDAIPQAGAVTEGATGSVTAAHTFTTAGVYMVKLTVTDNCGNAGTATQVGGVDAMVVIFDPSAGFVTGGGWINSPAGAYVPAPLLTGKANFGFVSKYKKGAATPSGETEFQYKVGNLNFHSTSYDWLVVSGARAQYKGSGTINNAGDYSFILTAIDGEISGGGGMDKFRMKITNKTGGGLVYDNLLNAPDSNDPTTVLGGGSIVIHTGGNSSSAMAGDARDEGGSQEILTASAPVEFGLSQNSPNPFDRSTLISFSLPERSRVSLVVYDLVGREVRTLVEGEWEPGRHSATLNKVSSDGSALDAGVYFVRMNAQSLSSGRSFSSLRKMVLVK